MACKYSKAIPCHGLPCKGCAIDNAVLSDRKRIIEQLEKRDNYVTLDEIRVTAVNRVINIVNGGDPECQ